MGAVALLTILRNGETVKTCPIEGEAVLGRAEGCVIRLDDRAISRQHAVFKLVDGGVQVERKSEFAPLMINGADTTRALLREADVISIGPYLLKVSVTESATAAPSQDTAPVAPESAPAPRGGATLALVPPLGEEPVGDAPEGDALLPALDAGLGADPALDPAGPALGLDSPAGDLAPDLNLELGGGGAMPGIESPGEVLLAGGPDADAGGLSIGGVLPPDEVVEQAEDDAKTKLSPATKLAVRLVFAPGSANHVEFEMPQDRDEVSIGRGKNCDIVLNDKKSSRKNSIIRRAGLSFSIKDLGSANGTYVNGVRVQEQELFGDDVVKVGGVEFVFKAMSADYASRERGFMAVPTDPTRAMEGGGDPMLPMLDGSSEGANGFAALPMASHQPQGGFSALGLPENGAPGAGGAAGLAGITGIGPADAKNMSLIEKVRNFKDLPRKQQIIIAIIVLGLGYFFFIEEEAVVEDKPKPKPSPVAKVAQGPRTFESLTPEQQRFVEAQHALAFDLFRNRDYDKAIYELDKIFQLIPEYKDSSEIARYAKEGKRKLEAFEEEKRRKEEEARLKAKIQELVAECKERMAKKHYEQARELFTQISVLDPDNAQIAEWKREIEQYEEDLRAAANTKMVQGQINQRAWEVYAEGMALKKRGKYHSAIEIFGKVADIGASDPKPLSAAKQRIRECAAAIKGAREPVLADAAAAEALPDYPKAFALFKKATRIDPPHPAGYAGMARIRGILHERAKVVYTEAVLAESFSDFALARKKFKECLEIAPTDDIYHERAERKLARYFKKDEAAPQ